jgi:hypothetical protein
MNKDAGEKDTFWGMILTNGPKTDNTGSQYRAQIWGDARGYAGQTTSRRCSAQVDHKREEQKRMTVSHQDIKSMQNV